MKHRNIMPTSLLAIAAVALLASPTALADCSQKCTNEDPGACANGALTGAGSAGGAAAVCIGSLNIQVTVFGDNYACSAWVVSEAAACGDEPDTDSTGILPRPSVGDITDLA